MHSLPKPQPPSELFRLNGAEQAILACCEDPANLAEITRMTALPRSTVEYLIRKLVKQGLMRAHKAADKRTRYSPIPIEKAIDLALGKSGDSIESFFKIHKGTKQIVGMWKQISELPKNTRIIALQPYDSFKILASKVDPMTVERINTKMTEKGFIFEAIIHERMMNPFFQVYSADLAKRAALSFTDRLEDIVRVRSDFINEKAEMFIINSRLILIDWYKEEAIEVINENIAQLAASMFAIIKSFGERYNHGEAIKRSIASK